VTELRFGGALSLWEIVERRFPSSLWENEEIFEVSFKYEVK